jgi:glutathione S-transferase
MNSIELVSHELCPFVQRAVIALTEKGVPFTRTNIDLDDRPQWFKDISPLGKVPLLRVQGEVIFESAVLLEYLDETHTPALHPSDPIARAKHRAWIEYSSSLLMDNYAFLLAPDAASMLAQRDVIRAKIERLEPVLAAGPYFAGSAFSLVDAAFAPFFGYWDVFERIGDFGVFEQSPKVRAWRRALAQRASVRAAFGANFETLARGAMRKRKSHLLTLLQPHM